MTEEIIKKPRVKAVTKSEKSLACNYTQPNIFKIASSFVADDVDYSPKPQELDRIADVFACNSTRTNRQVILNHRASEVLDFGVKISIPDGYKINGNVNQKYNCLGLICCTVYLDIEKRLKFIVTNAGKQTPIIIPDKEFIGSIWIEPIFYFDWMKND